MGRRFVLVCVCVWRGGGVEPLGKFANEGVPCDVAKKGDSDSSRELSFVSCLDLYIQRP